MHIYLINAENTNLYKIGLSHNLTKRVKQLQTSSPHKIVLVESWKTQWGKKLEFTLHRVYSMQRQSGEWFELNTEQVENFLENCNKIESSFNILKENNNKFI